MTEAGREAVEEWHRLAVVRQYAVPVSVPVQPFFDNFPYKKLTYDQVRFIALQQDNDSAVIQCSLHTQTLSLDSDFTAVSYTWGTRYTKNIILDGRRITVSDNCWYALWQLRHQKHNGLLWLDALCINQLDLAEKASQVANMGRVYELAQGVTACIGAHADDSEHLLERLHDMIEDKEAESPTTTFEFYLSARLTPHRVTNDFVRIADAASHMAQRPYWHRAWIVQELMVSRNADVLVGMDRISLECLCCIVQRVAALSYPSPIYARIFTTAPILYSGSSRRFYVGIETLIWQYRGAACSNLLDQVYAFLQLTRVGKGQGTLVVDYAISTFELLNRVLDIWENKGHGFCDLLDEVGAVCRALQINANHDHIRNSIEQRRQQPALVQGLVPVSEDWLQPYEAITLSRDVEGHLSVPIEFEKIVSGPSSIFLEHFERQVLETSNETTGSIPIYSGSTVVALACEDAQPGDLLLYLNGSIMMTLEKDKIEVDIALIVRQYKDDVFQIVGQAILKEGLQISWWAHMRGQFNEGKAYSASFSREDLIIFIAQGYHTNTGPRSWQSISQAEIDSHFHRPKVSVAGHSLSSYVQRS